ncbi:hypothetical protein ACFRJ8_14660 [Arthrobacter sp. NPDC056886]|uniref:hypothetical protein n=1 Tax=Arthrobacter sp. NPDC056886 TaxID=3345960 RepID=UPI003670ECC2
MNEFPWAAIVSGLIAASVGVLTALWARRSQSETNKLTGTNFEVERYNKFANEVQEERDLAKKELKDEREQHKNDFGQLRKDFEEFKKSVQIQFSGYRAYIHGLRGQVHEMGGVPLEWPKDLDQ